MIKFAEDFGVDWFHPSGFAYCEAGAYGMDIVYPEDDCPYPEKHLILDFERDYKYTDYSGPPAHPGRSLAQLDRASAHLIQSAFRHMPIADQPIY